MSYSRAIVEASSRVYEGLRSGGLGYETLLDLAIVLDDHGVSTPAVRELLTSEPADLTRAAEAVLRETSFEPTFELEPGWWRALEDALAVVERDARATGVTGPLRLVVPEWEEYGRAWVEFRGSFQGNGLPPSTGRDPRTALTAVADAAQEVIVEVIWRAWPVCAEHDRGLRAAIAGETPSWVCSAAGTHPFAPIGGLPAA